LPVLARVPGPIYETHWVVADVRVTVWTIARFGIGREPPSRRRVIDARAVVVEACLVLLLLLAVELILDFAPSARC
jgi:hypothetical protein